MDCSSRSQTRTDTVCHYYAYPTTVLHVIRARWLNTVITKGRQSLRGALRAGTPSCCASLPSRNTFSDHALQCHTTRAGDRTLWYNTGATTRPRPKSRDSSIPIPSTSTPFVGRNNYPYIICFQWLSEIARKSYKNIII